MSISNSGYLDYIKISRRTFIAGLDGGLFTLSCKSLSPALSLAQTKVPDIGMAKGAPEPASRTAVEILGGMGAFVGKNQHVLIKPNMSFSQPPESATNTHPEVIKALVQMCLEAGASQVTIPDHTLSESEACKQRSGIGALQGNIPNCSVETPSAAHRFETASLPRGKQLQSSKILKQVLSADVLIAAPVAKHHSSTGVSLSMKGMMGLIQNREIFHWKYDLNTAIVDLCSKLQADLAVVDATRALTTDGPSGPGNVVHPETVIASRDMVAADAQAVSLVPWYGRSLEPGQVGHIKQAHERGLGSMDLDNLRIESVEL